MRASVNHSVSLVSQSFRKRQDVTDLLCGFSTHTGVAQSYKLYTPPRRLRPKMPLFEKNNKCWLDKKPPQWKLLLRSWLAAVCGTFEHQHTLTGKENKPHKPVWPQHRVPFPRLRECVQTLHCCFCDLNGEHCQSGQLQTYFLFLVHVSGCSQAPFITQSEQTAAQIQQFTYT